ncbi:STAS domain-containing protein [Roseiconus lacunae]|uniref:STAS domain-containing protein n=2 Tax=Roseiconus lacunae TaxID=2605694 RepID=A0ABT7PQL0_9BACT|nr:STAS domain-containing protein [Roseiconus lacunae]MDM4018559.1 STAS domain-containing protein [Roseiconus lacunae]
MPRRRQQTNIRIDDSVMVVCPTTKSISTRKLAKYFATDVVERLESLQPSELRKVVVDLSGVQWISSAGLNELIHLQTLTRSSGAELHLSGLCETVRDVFRITRLERFFDVELSEWDASTLPERELGPSLS